MISGSYLEDEGSIVASSFQRATVRATGDYDFCKWLKVGTNMQYTYECTNSPGGQTETGYSNNVTYMADYIAPVYPMYIRDADGRVMHDEASGHPMYDYGMKGLGLPYSRAFVAVAIRPVHSFMTRAHTCMMYSMVNGSHRLSQSTGSR